MIEIKRESERNLAQALQSVNNVDHPYYSLKRTYICKTLCYIALFIYSTAVITLSKSLKTEETKTNKSLPLNLSLIAWMKH